MVTLRANDSVNLSTGVVTRSDDRRAHESDMITYPSKVSQALRRNNLRALHLMIMDSVWNRSN